MAQGEKTLAVNRRARHDYFIDESYEAGMELKGSEVKSIRQGKVHFKDGYIMIKGSEAYLVSSHVSPYEKGSSYNPDPDRDRRLLLHKKEIRRLIGLVKQQGVALIPLRLYLKRGLVKLEFAVARGKKNYDKRHAKAEQTAKRQMEKAFSRNQRSH